MNDRTPAELAAQSDGEITPEQEAAAERDGREEEAAAEQALLDELAAEDPDAYRSEKLIAWDAFRTAGTDLMALDTSGPIPWVPGAERIIRRGERQMWVANFGEGKTQAAVQFAAQVCRAGGHVIYLDVENDTREMAERLQPTVESLGDCRTDERLAYRTDADLLTDGDKLTELVAALPTADLLLIDSMTRVLGALGLDENSNQDIAAFTTSFTDVLSQQAGLAVLILDNTGHTETTRARGAVSKAALVEAVYTVSGGKDVTEEKHGTLRLKRARSRSGKLAGYITARSGGGNYGPLEPQEGDAPTESGNSLKKLEAKQSVVKHMREHDGESFATADLEEVAGVKRKALTNYMQELCAEGRVEQVPSTDAGFRWQFSQGTA